MMNNPLAQHTAESKKNSFATLVEYAEYLNDGFIAKTKGWFWVAGENEAGPTLQKMELSRMGNAKYVLEYPERAQAYALKVSNGDESLAYKIIQAALGKNRLGLLREDKYP